VVAEYEYSPFGEVLEAQGPEAKKNMFLFAGRYYIILHIRGRDI
jgi:hypothetical protein